MCCQLVYAPPSSSTFVYNYRHMHMYTFDDYCVLTTYTLIFQLQYVSVYLLLEASPDVYTLATPSSRVSISIFICVDVSYEHTHTMFIEKCSLLYAPPLPICLFCNIVFICIYSSTWSCAYVCILHQDGSIQIKSIHVNKWMRNQTHICAYIHTRIMDIKQWKWQKKHINDFKKLYKTK